MAALHRNIQGSAEFSTGDPQAGYYNDLRDVALEYGGPAEAVGWLELSIRRRQHANPVTLLQLGLGAWQLAPDHEEGDGWKQVAAAVTRWALRDLDGDGFLVYHFDMPHTYALAAPWSSALAQGQALSLLVRCEADLRGRNEAIIAVARTLTDPESPLVRVSSDGPILQEYPTDPPSDVLNGWMFALLGLYDAAHAGQPVPDEVATACRQAFATGMQALSARLDRYTLSSGWTTYDRYPHPIEHVASPFYHALHIELAKVLNQLAADASLDPWLRRWQDARDRRSTRLTAVGRKVAFRLLKPRGRRAS